MRQQAIGATTLYYPDYLTYSGDNNYVMLKVPSGAATLDVEIGGKRQTYESESDTVVMDVSLMLRANGVYGVVQVDVYVAMSSPAYSNTYTFTVYYTRGWTLADRYHGSGRRVMLPSGVTSVDILVVGACTIRGGVSDVTVNEAQIVSYPVSGSGTVWVEYGIRRSEGYVNDPGDATRAYYEVEMYDCQPKGGCVLRWYDADGCVRYVVGKVLSRGQRAESVAYSAIGYGDALSTLRDKCGRVVTSIGRTIEVGVAQADEALHLEEMLFSPEVSLRASDEWVPIVPDYESVTTSMTDATDVVLKMKIQG